MEACDVHSNVSVLIKKKDVNLKTYKDESEGKSWKIKVEKMSFGCKS